jgi:hypothetical protein
MRKIERLVKALLPLLYSDPTLAAKTETRRGWGTQTSHLQETWSSERVRENRAPGAIAVPVLVQRG